MNRFGKIIVWLGVLAIVAMCLVPPWQVAYKRRSGKVWEAPIYRAIVDPPRVWLEPWRGGNDYLREVRIDRMRLAVQCLPVLVIMAAAALTCRRRGGEHE